MRSQFAFWLVLRALALLLVVPFPEWSQNPAPQVARSIPQATQWVKHEAPQHYSVETPPGWTAFPDKEKGWVHLMGTQGEDVVIWPVFVPGAVDLRAAPLIHARLAMACPYNANWESLQLVGPTSLRSRGVQGEMLAVSSSTWMQTPDGLAGFFYLTAARETNYRQRQSDFVRILQSFRVFGKPAGAAGPAAGALQYVKFADPYEGAFTVDVPAGWKTEGGLFRFNAQDYRPAIQSTSPDGLIRVSVGDAQIPPYTDMTGAVVPFPEGTAYAPGGFPTISLRFRHAGVYSREYVMRTIAPICPNVQITDVKDRPDLIPEAVGNNPSLRVFGILTIGEAAFRCGAQAQPMVGLCRASTAGTPTGTGGGSWKVVGIGCYLAPSERAAFANSIWDHVGKKFLANPEWAQTQVRIEGSTSQIMSGFNNWRSDQMASSQRAKDASESELARRRSNATLGIVDVADPQTGRSMRVESGSDYYWVDAGGQIVGTRTATSPGIDFRQLVQLP